MSLFLTVFLALVGLFVLCALMAELTGKSRPEDYTIPKDWKSRIYDVPPHEGEVELPAGEQSRRFDKGDESKTDEAKDRPRRKELTSGAWLTIFFVIPYILCLILLTQWKSIEDWLSPEGASEKQINGNPAFESREQ